MNRATNIRNHKDSTEAYERAKVVTPQLIQTSCATFAQMIADDTGEPVSVGVMGFRVVRKPTTSARRLQA